MTLVRNELAGVKGYEVVKTSREGRESRYRVEHMDDGMKILEFEQPSGLVNRVESDDDGTRTAFFSDGTVVAETFQGDPRWGGSAPLLQERTIQTPGGVSRSVTFNRSVTLADTSSPLSLETLVDTINFNGAGNDYVRTYDAITRTFTDISPENRIVTSVIDPQERDGRTRKRKRRHKPGAHFQEESRRETQQATVVRPAPPSPAPSPQKRIKDLRFHNLPTQILDLNAPDKRKK